MSKLRFYDGDKLDALASLLSISVNQIQVWSDNSLTVESGREYYVTKGKRKHGELVGRVGKFNIYITA